MKQILLSIIMITALAAPSQAGRLTGINYKESVEIKNAKIIICVYEHKKRESAEETQEIDKINANIESIIKEYWTYSEISEVLPLKEAIQKAKSDKNVYVLFIGDNASYNNSRNYNANLLDPSLLLSTGRGFPLLRFELPFSESGISKALIVYSVRLMQTMLEKIHNKEAVNHWQVYQTMMGKTSELKGKTLYIPEEYLHEKVTEEVIKENYTYEFKIVSSEEWKAVILDAKEDEAFMIYYLLNKETYVHKIGFIDAQTGTYLGVYQMGIFQIGQPSPAKINKKTFENMKKYYG
ncbi:MAG: hypothetical protein PF541_00035, partial [Prolixibacteraceae bacterium]|nr:hypothetical protein [Prolixibacteraceae bacterium]